MNPKINREPSSFRDPSGFMYYKGNKVFRQVNLQYKKNLDYLLESGLYDKLIKQGSLLSHKRIGMKSAPPKNPYALFEAKTIPFISYPYEWTFSQLKDAALLTLQIETTALDYEMTLKDASCYNVQFLGGKPVFIDLLSFEKYKENTPWVAYKQFCQHFFGPLVLMSMVDVRMNQLLKIYLDGIPLDLVSKLLPRKTLLSLSIVSHIHLHAKNQKKFAASGNKIFKTGHVSKIALRGIIDNLKRAIAKLAYPKGDTEWGGYYTYTNYSHTSFGEKKELVKKYLEIVKPETVLDIGANNGEFSRLASNHNIFTVAADIDPTAVEKNYLHVKKLKENNLLPLVIDITNPSPAIGWMNTERKSFIQRSSVDLVIALALIHHLAISDNLPFDKIADCFQKLGRYLIIEFIPKADTQVQRLLQTRKDIFNLYSQAEFEKAFVKHFSIIQKKAISGSMRTCYLMKRKN